MDSEQIDRQCKDNNPKTIIRRFPNDMHVYHICMECSLKPEWASMNQIDRKDD
jgi:hypothetical protein